MQSIDLTDYVVQPTGTWSKNRDFFTPGMLTLVEPDDGVTLAGPLRVRVCIQAQNSFNVFGTSVQSVQAKELFSYVLEIPPGQTWTYQGLPFALRGTGAGSGTTAPITSAAATISPASATLAAGRTDSAIAGAATAALAITPGDQQILTAIGRRLVPGVNDRLIIVIRPAGPEACIDPCVSYDPCTPKHDCHCGCKPCQCHTCGDDPSCDFAVGNTPDIGVFFPAACEPCTPGASIGMPALKGPSLIIPPARGGTVRTRYFNGMFMTSEDLETDQRNVRLKRALMNRALGQGVVWGLHVGLDGEAICVGPGYGVDCCGNDIVLTTPYRVDAAALLRDPAAAAAFAVRNAATSGFSTNAAAASIINVTRTFALVLEYLECPEQPRPVHGDPCAPDTSRCETSRIRETARLRLAPPCPIDDSGPIKAFLAEIETLKRDPVVGQILAAATPKPQASALPIHVPFTVTINTIGTATGQSAGSVTLTPKAGTNPQDRDRDDIGLSPNNDFVQTFVVTLEAENGFVFSDLAGLTVTKIKQLQSGVVVTVDVNMPLTSLGGSPTKLSFSDGFDSEVLPLGRNGVPIPPQANPIPAGYAYQIKNWRMRETSGQELSSQLTELQVTPLTFGDWQETPWGASPESNVPDDASRVLHVQVLPSDVRAAATTPPPIPCFNECDPTTRRFPVTFPWLHEDPTRPGKTADPQVLVLALVYAFLAIESARNKVGTSQAVNSAQLQVATAIYNATWKLFFGTVPDTERFRLTDALQRLLRAWCCALLYPGPTCHCEPHGVVIGCASVSSGRIQSVDPWGGRRWVVHYPLLSYWGQLFGMTPLDAIASKIFGLICCIAGLPIPDSGFGTNTGGTGTTIFSSLGGSVPSAGRGSEINFGRALLVISPRAEADARIAALGFKPERVVSVSPVDFVSRFADALRFESDPASVRRPIVHFTVLGLPDFHLVALGDPEPGTPTPARDAGRLRDLVQAMLARRTGGRAVPPLLRTFTEDLSRDVISSVSIEGADPPQKAVAARLGDSGITTLGALLGRAPEDLHSEVLRGEQAEGLAALLDHAEADATAVSKAVADAVIAAATDRRVFARADFRQAERANDLGKRLGDKLTALDLKVAGRLSDLVTRAAGGQ